MDDAPPSRLDNHTDFKERPTGTRSDMHLKSLFHLPPEDCIPVRVTDVCLRYTVPQRALANNQVVHKVTFQLSGRQGNFQSPSPRLSAVFRSVIISSVWPQAEAHL